MERGYPYKMADPFEEILMANERAYRNGMQAGRIHGKKQALIDGGMAGWTKGVELGMELGLYLSIINTLLTKEEKGDVSNSGGRSNATVKLCSLQSSILGLCVQELDSKQCQSQLKTIRANFQQITSKLNVQGAVRRKVTEDMSF